MMSPSGSVTAKAIVWLQPCCKRITGEVIARGDELILPVSSLGITEKVVDMFQLPPIVQQHPVKPIVIVFVFSPVKLC